MRSKISVVVTTYNHEEYLGECLQGVLDQTGDFDLEIIVGDDCSTDGTRQLAEQWRDRHPGLITLLAATENLGVTKNLKRCLDACSGEYIAICEGDDYWNHRGKLQAQMDLLQAHRECSMCFCAVTLYYQDQALRTAHAGQASLKSAFLNTEDLIYTNYIGTFSCCMYRAEIVRRLPPALFEMYTVDWMFNMACAEFGTIAFLRDSMCVYRLHSRGAWTGTGEYERREALCRHIDEYNTFFAYKYDRPFRQLKKRTQMEMHGLLRAEGRDTETRATFVGKLGAPILEAARGAGRNLGDLVRSIRRRL